MRLLIGCALAGMALTAWRLWAAAYGYRAASERPLAEDAGLVQFRMAVCQVFFLEGDVRDIVKWEREFQVWHYSVSHSMLLLRSVGVEGSETRIDVLFASVELMHLRTFFERLEISEAIESNKKGILGDADSELAGNLYVINGGPTYVLAGRCAWHEDFGDHHAPSKFGPLRATE
ncbi:hypothetical protein [Streptomyces sp. NPDC058382]|uniref:hypothetical protein n=1 Tax=unclassified Streptomyces TaxID=2593676 RepID=UPI0036316038